MAKATTFAEKAAKSQKKKDELINVKIVETVFNNDKKSYKFNYRYIKIKDINELSKV